VIGLPSAVAEFYTNTFLTRQWNVFQVIIILILMLAVVAFIVLVERGERRIPVQYAKRVVGRRLMGGQQTHLPLKVNAGGVIPIIFASSLLAFPQTARQIVWVKDNPWLVGMLDAISHGQPLYYLIYVVGIIFFCFFYVSIIFNPSEAADNMRKYGGFIPGIRPGKNTADYMNRILTRITMVGGLYLSVLSILPEIMISGNSDHDGGRSVPVGAVDSSGDYDFRHQAADAARGGHLHRQQFSPVAAGRAGSEFLLRRNLAAHRGGRGDGLRQPD